jgi:transcriptional repressor NrdR
MICPKCRSDTRVVSSRPHADDATVIVRRRHCVACSHRFDTQEGTVNIVRQRARKRVHQAACRAFDGPIERSALSAQRNERRIRQHLREVAAQH